MGNGIPDTWRLTHLPEPGLPLKAAGQQISPPIVDVRTCDMLYHLFERAKAEEGTTFVSACVFVQKVGEPFPPGIAYGQHMVNESIAPQVCPAEKLGPQASALLRAALLLGCPWATKMAQLYVYE